MLRALVGLCVLAVGPVPLLAQATLPEVSIFGSDVQDQVWDSATGLLYLSTYAGTIQRYNPATRTLLTPWNIGTPLMGADITPDGTSLYVADGTTPGGMGLIHKINTATGAVTNLNYALTTNESWGFDLKIGSNGIGFITGTYQGSGFMPLREINTATDQISDVPNVPGPFLNDISQWTGIARSTDRNELFFEEGNSSGGPVFSYEASNNTFPAYQELDDGLGPNSASINRNDSLIALNFEHQITILNSSLTAIKTITATDPYYEPYGTLAVAFDPTRDVLYAIQRDTQPDMGDGQIVEYNTNTWSVIYSQYLSAPTVGGLVGAADDMTVSDDGKYLFVNTGTGETMFLLPEPSMLAMTIFGSVCLFVRRREGGVTRQGTRA